MKTSELTGPALDWAVEYALLSHVANEEMRAAVASMHQRTKGIGYSINWAIGGPIIEREGITLKQVSDGTWRADYSKAVLKADKSAYAYLANKGQTPLVAAMRCFVASKLGEEVNIPAELKD